MACKQALKDFSSIGEAENYLKEQNLIFADKKSDRQTKEGVLTFIKNDLKAQILRINCETDFVAKNQDFLDFSKKMALGFFEQLQDDNEEIVMDKEKIQNVVIEDNNVEIHQKLITAKIQEKIYFSSLSQIFLDKNDVLGYYIHKSLGNDLGPSLSYVKLSCDKKS